MQRCDTCEWVHDQRSPEDDEPSYRCGYRVPFWVPLPTHDYGSWVKADDGAKCQCYEPAHPQAVGGLYPEPPNAP